MTANISPKNTSTDVVFPLTTLLKNGLQISPNNFITNRSTVSETDHDWYFRNPREDFNERRILKPLVIDIEAYVKTHASLHGTTASISVKIATILKSNQSCERKAANLGALLFFLERGDVYFWRQNDPFDWLLLEYSNDIQALNNVNDIKEYILRGFVRLIITSRDKVNAGAFYTIKEILQQTKYSSLFEDEGAQMLKFLDRELLMQSLRSSLDDPIAIHPETHAFFLTLKDPVEQFATSVDFKRLTLFLFLRDLRQDCPNCYAIAPIIYGIHYSPFKLFSFLTEILRDGGFDLENGVINPISSLMEKKQNLNQQNVMQQIMVAAVEFLETNYRPDIHSPFVISFRSSKSHLLEHLKKEIFENLRTTMPDFKTSIFNEFFAVFQERFEQSIWIDDVAPNSLVIDEESVDYLSEDEKNDLIKLLKNCRQLKLITKQKTISISTITDFKIVLREMLEELAVQFAEKMADTNENKKFILFVRGFVVSQLINDAICRFLYLTNHRKMPHLTEQNYNELDILYFLEDGGTLFTSLNYLELNCEKHVFSGKQNQYSAQVGHIVALCNWTKSKFALEKLKGKRDIFIGSSLNHAFIVTPFRFLHLLKKEPEIAIRETIWTPGWSTLLTPLSREKMKKILNGCMYPYDHERVIREYENKIAASFRDKIIDDLRPVPSLIPQFKKAFNKILTCVTLVEFNEKINFQELLNEILNKKVDLALAQKIEETFNVNLTLEKKDEYTPSFLAYNLKLSFFKYGIFHFDTHDLEPVIAAKLKRPCSYIIGDLNYLRNERHKFLVIQWNFASSTISLASRDSEEEAELSPELWTGLSQLAIYYPKFSF